MKKKREPLIIIQTPALDEPGYRFWRYIGVRLPDTLALLILRVFGIVGLIFLAIILSMGVITMYHGVQGYYHECIAPQDEGEKTGLSSVDDSTQSEGEDNVEKTSHEESHPNNNKTRVASSKNAAGQTHSEAATADTKSPVKSGVRADNAEGPGQQDAAPRGEKPEKEDELSAKAESEDVPQKKQSNQTNESAAKTGTAHEERETRQAASKGRAQCTDTSRKQSVDRSQAAGHAAISELMSGFEFFILAPLPYILLRTLAAYMADGRRRKDGHPTDKAIEALISVKALATGLLIAVLATHVVSIIITAPRDWETNGDKSVDSVHAFPWIKALCGVAVLLVLSAYYAILENLCHRRKAHAEQSSGGLMNTLREVFRPSEDNSE